ncbi:hypothetical protein CDL15_Pgr001374 [Punica granatum]|uniref:Uncharacterized protein n=1 Tax=Punica granatum TaxID=22663 RepID=A0A218WLM6_PUNGR|nr:hypothetical protein CDL15_Pgr001374 [Punica granatum]
MALQLSSAYCTCFSGLCHRRRVRARRIRAVASKDFATLKAEEEKVTMLAIEACLGVAPATGITSNGMLGAVERIDVSNVLRVELLPTICQYCDRKMKAAKAAFDTSVDNGIIFSDTTEVYGFWKKRLQDAYQKLKKGGVPLASNHSLICELGITLISYSSIPQAREKVVPIPGSSQECRTLQAKDFAGAPGCRLNGPFLLAGIERVDVIIFCCSEVMGYEPSGEDLRYLKLPVASRSVVRSTTRVESYVQIAFVISSADLLLPIMTSYPFPNETSSLRLRYVSIHADLSLLTVE